MPGYLYMGEFDSESFLRDENLSKLPAIEDKERTGIIHAMDSLLFPFCNSGDVLITRFQLGDTIKDYLDGIGFKFTNQCVYKNEYCANKCVYSLTADAIENNSLDRQIFSGDVLFSPYSIIPSAIEMCQRINIKYFGPHIDIIKKVNSKIYSTYLNKEINHEYPAVIVNSQSELQTEGKRILENSSFLVKDPFGVSGKGNMLVNSEGILKRIVSYVGAQEEKGLITRLVLEPFLNKKLDFSCELVIQCDGSYTIICIQHTTNVGFAYQGSATANQDFINFLETKNYFIIIEKIVSSLHKEGYYGDVCVDSMLLENDEIVPLVEINARKSMGFINFYIDELLKNYSTSGNLSFFSVGFTSDIKFELILKNMEKRGILFKKGCTKGIIPLSETALYINRELDFECNFSKLKKGRFYMSVTGKSFTEKQKLILEMKELLKSLSFRVY